MQAGGRFRGASSRDLRISAPCIVKNQNFAAPNVLAGAGRSSRMSSRTPTGLKVISSRGLSLDGLEVLDGAGAA
jgi:hypothetical protein